MTHSSDAIPSNSADGEIENRTKLDFFLPVIDAASSYIDRRFNVECLSVLKHILSLMARGENFDNAIRKFEVLQSWMRIYEMQKTTCCFTMRHTDPLIVS